MTNTEDRANNLKLRVELPSIAHVPYVVQSDKRLSDACKIFYGQILSLSKTYGYISSTNDQLADMKKTSKKNIERWIMILEKTGYIKRVTENKRIESEKGTFVWKKLRKIYIEDVHKSKK